MKVLVVSAYRVSGKLGGVSRYLRSFQEIGNSHGHKITIVERGVFVPIITRSKKEMNIVSNQRVRFWYRLPRYFERIYQIYTIMVIFLFTLIESIRNRYDIILADEVGSSGLVSWFLQKLRGNRYLIQLHGWPEACDATLKYRNLKHRVQKMIMQNSCQVVFAFPEVRVCLSRMKIESSKFRELSLGVNLERFFPSIDTRNLLRERLKIPEENFVVGFVGRLSPEKGLFSMCEIISKTQQERVTQKITVVIVGSGEMEQDLRNTARDLKIDCRFIGHQHNTAKWYNVMDLYLALSSRETFGLSVLEAMATGVPVIASNLSAFRRLIPRDLAVGYLVDPKDTERVAYNIKSLIDNPQVRINMSESARENAERFSMEKSVLKLLEIMDQL
jgi:glycosyltransferase involved in cell wall biosynthesis